MSDASGAAAAADRLLNRAADVAAGHAGNHDRLAAFIDSYREWLIAHHELPGTRPEQTERTRLLLCAMASAATLGEAVERLVRFRRLVWGDRGLACRFVDRTVALVLDQPFRAGLSGAVSDIWSLSLLLAELEFLAGGRLADVWGVARPSVRLGAAAAALLFDRRLTFGGAELLLVLPMHHLERPIVARSAAIPAFLEGIVPATVAAARTDARLATLVAAMIRAEVEQSTTAPATLETVARRLGLSIATLRRRLEADGTTFRRLRDDVLGGLAADMLAAGAAVETVGARLGYSDGSSFRRAFHRHYGCSPTDWRRRSIVAGPDAAQSADGSRPGPARPPVRRSARDR